MKINKTFVLLVVALVAIFTPSCNGEFLVLDPDDPLGGTFNGEGFTRTAGYEFTVGAEPLSVVALGVRDWDGGGLANSHQVGLWDVDGNLLAAITVTAGASTNGFRYDSLSPVLLNAGQTYVIGATYVHLDADRIGISRTFENGSPTYSSAVTFNVIRFGDSATGLSFPDLSGFPDVELGQFGPNAEFLKVPEPSAAVLLGAEILVLFLCGRVLPGRFLVRQYGREAMRTWVNGYGSPGGSHRFRVMPEAGVSHGAGVEVDHSV